MHATRGLTLKEGSESLWRRGGDPISSDSPSALTVSIESSHGHELFSARTIPFAARTLAGNHHVNMDGNRSEESTRQKDEPRHGSRRHNVPSRQSRPPVATVKPGENSGLTGKTARILTVV